MKENISRTAGNVYERIDKESWMIHPRYGEIEPTSHFDASKIALFPEDKRRPLQDVPDEEIRKIVKENMINSDTKSLSLKNN